MGKPQSVSDCPASGKDCSGNSRAAFSAWFAMKLISTGTVWPVSMDVPQTLCELPLGEQGFYRHEKNAKLIDMGHLLSLKENWKHCREVMAMLVGSAEVGHTSLEDQTSLGLGLFTDFQSAGASL